MIAEISVSRYEADYHIPVLWREVVGYLITKKNGTYVDCTLGGGGHANAILDHIEEAGLLLGIDQDEDALNFARNRLKGYKNFRAQKGNFSNISSILKEQKLTMADGILLDLGVSSHQLDESSRGFAFSADAPLDMRMDRENETTAADVLNTFGEKELADIFYQYGEERRSYQIAAKIIDYRKQKRLETTTELKSIIANIYKGKQQIKALARVFQSLRIHLNRELDVLATALKDSFSYLSPHGRLAVIAYHSLEDRLVKGTFKYWETECICPPELPVCQCDKRKEVKLIKPYPMIPEKDEIEYNSRSRSAKLRICEKIAGA